MIDGFKCSCIGLDAELWTNNPRLDFGLIVSESTGEVLTQRKEANANSLRFVITPSSVGGKHCSIVGSLHKHKNENGHNWDDFTFFELCEVLEKITLNYDVDLETAPIHSLEIGVNIELNYSPALVLKSAICHKGKPFDSLDKKDKRLGIICTHTDYAIKLYDKGYQSRFFSASRKHLLRYEVKLFRQRMLNPFSIRTMSDLQNVEKVAPLLQLLIEKLNEIVFFDFKNTPKGLNESKRLKWQQFSNPKFWENLDKKNYFKAKKRFQELSTKYKTVDCIKIISDKTTNKWVELLESKQKNGRSFPHVFSVDVSTKKAKFSKLEYMLENITLRDVNFQEKKEEKKDCFCASCGRKLVGQKNGSRFCSEKVYGKEAKKCRNKDSNKRLIVKRKLFKAMVKELMIRVCYDYEGVEYCDVLGVSEICLTRQWLNRVKSVELLNDKLVVKQGKQAKEYLKTITKK